LPILKSEIQTFSGGSIDPLNPLPEDINIEDIAHALSNQCRFTGHTRAFYSVAQHSVLASIYAEDVDPELAKQAFPSCTVGRDLAKLMLMHDASEAYLMDLPRPLKNHADFATSYKMAEERLMLIISNLFQFRWPMCDVARLIDNRMLFTEKRDLLIPRDWGCEVEPFEEEIDPWTPATSKKYFLKRFHQLFAD